MERFTISLDDELAHAFDHLIAERGYGNRSEAVRDVLRAHLARLQEGRDAEGPCVANLSYVYNHHERDLSDRLARLQHDHHAMTLATTHVHLDHYQCIETVLLKGPASEVRRFADRLMAERGVHHGQLNVVMVGALAPTPEHAAHAHGHDHGHRHLG